MQTGPFKIYIEEVPDKLGFVRVVDFEGVGFEEYYMILRKEETYVELSSGSLMIRSKNGDYHYVLDKGMVISIAKFFTIAELINRFNLAYDRVKKRINSFDLSVYKKEPLPIEDEQQLSSKAGESEEEIVLPTEDDQEEIILDDFVNNHSCPNILKAGRGILKVLIRYVYHVAYNEGYLNGKTKRFQ